MKTKIDVNEMIRKIKKLDCKEITVEEFLKLGDCDLSEMAEVIFGYHCDTLNPKKRGRKKKK
jgi:hypothetical protein